MSGIEDVLRRQAEIIESVGWAVLHIAPNDDDPATDVSFSYTVGLTEHDYPELLLSGLRPEVGHSLLNDLARRVYDRAERFSHGQHIKDLIAGYDAIVVEGEPTDELMPGMAVARYGRDRVRLQQVVWPDAEGRFPWDAGYEYEPNVQPLIARL